jgi:non-lysosomal glucosylceramidase
MFVNHDISFPQTVMAKAVSQDSDGDGLIDNSGFADQTYDAWIVSGPR